MNTKLPALTTFTRLFLGSFLVVGLALPWFFRPALPLEAAGDLITHWKFDEETPGATAMDSSGSGFHGTPKGVTGTVDDPEMVPQPSMDTPPVSFPNPRSLFFQGDGGSVTGSFIDVSGWTVDTSNGFTVSLWAKPTTTPGSQWQRFIDFGNGPGSDNIVFAQNGSASQVFFEVYDGSSTTKIIGDHGTWMTGEWHYYTATIDADGNATIYVDGESVASGVTNKPVDMVRSNKYVGKSNWGDDYYQGYMDDIRFYSRALTPQEVVDLTNGEEGPGIPPALVSTVPADDAQGVSVSADLELAFDKPVVAGVGSITLYKALDNSVVQTFAMSGPAVSGLGTDTLTLNLTERLAYASEYYVLIDATALKDVSDTPYAGFDTATTWNFKTEDDGDTIEDAVEQAAPNGGDGNNDGIPDWQQPYVSSFVNPATGAYVTLAVDAACRLDRTEALSEASLAFDPSFTYPMGLLDFAVSCGAPGFTTSVKQYYFDPPSGDFVVRKFLEGNFTTVSGATTSTQSIGGRNALVVEYAATDGGELDADGLTDGVLVDPAGPGLAIAAVPAVEAPDTGLPTRNMAVFALVLVAGALLAVRGLAGGKARG